MEGELVSPKGAQKGDYLQSSKTKVHSPQVGP